MSLKNALTALESAFSNTPLKGLEVSLNKDHGGRITVRIALAAEAPGDNGQQGVVLKVEGQGPAVPNALAAATKKAGDHLGVYSAMQASGS